MPYVHHIPLAKSGQVGANVSCTFSHVLRHPPSELKVAERFNVRLTQVRAENYAQEHNRYSTMPMEVPVYPPYRALLQEMIGCVSVSICLDLRSCSENILISSLNVDSEKVDST